MADRSKVEDKVNNLKGGHGTILFFEDKAGELLNTSGACAHAQRLRGRKSDTPHMRRILRRGRCSHLP